MKINQKQHLILILTIFLMSGKCFGWLAGNFNNDCTVDFADFAVLAEDYNETGVGLTGDIDDDNDVDLEDVFLLCENWLATDPCSTPCDWQVNEAPVAIAQDVNVIEYDYWPITLTGTDDGFGGTDLIYKITSLPTLGYLKDAFLGALPLDSNHIPYTIRFGGESILYGSDANGADSFEFKVVDSQGEDSNAATVDVNVIEWAYDCLGFDGSGWVEFNDANAYDVVDGWAVDVWIKTKQPFATILRKIDAGGTGWELNLKSGKPQFEVWKDGQRVAYIRSSYRVDNNYWNEIGANYNVDSGTGTNLAIMAALSNNLFEMPSGTWQIENFSDINDINVDYTNDANLVMGYQDQDGFNHLLDKLRFFSALDDPSGFGAITVGLSARNESINEVVLGFGKLSDVLFMFDEGSGTTVTDLKTGLTGTLSDPNHVKWQPFNWQFIDITNVRRR